MRTIIEEKKWKPRRWVLKRLGISPKTLWLWIKKGLFPPPIKMGGFTYFPEEYVERYIEYLEKHGEVKPYWWKEEGEGDGDGGKEKCPEMV